MSKLEEKFKEKWLSHIRRPNYPQKSIDLMNAEFKNMLEQECIGFAESLAYNYDYKEGGKWTIKEWDDEPIIDVREYTTIELFQLYQKSKENE